MIYGSMTLFSVDEKLCRQESRRRLANLFLLLAIVFGMLFIFLEPPFVCPDENAHFINICRISHGNLFVNVENGKIGSYMTDEEFYFLATTGGPYNGENALKYSLGAMNEYSNRAASQNLIFFENNFSMLNPLPYLLPSAVLYVSQLLGMEFNAYTLLQIAKIINLLFYALIIRWAICKTAVFPKTMFLLALMPMAIFQGASASYDASLIACSLLLLAFVSRILCYGAGERVTAEDIVAICLSAAFVVCCKIAYAPLLLLLLAIPVKKLGSVKRYFACIGYVVVVLAVTYLVPSLVNSTITAGIEMPLTDLQIQQNAYVSQNYDKLPQVVLSTTEFFGESWVRGFFGILGWLDTHFPKSFIHLFLALLIFSAIAEAGAVKGIRFKARLFSLLGVAIFYVGTIVTMYIQWNPVLAGIVGGDIAYGGQGRYFIPVALFAVFAFCSPLFLRFRRVGHALERVTDYAVPVTAVSYLFLTFAILLIRYWC